MKTNKQPQLTELLAAVMPRVNGTPAGIKALAASIERGKAK